MMRAGASGAVFLTAFMFAFGPLIVALFDLFCWLVVGHQATSVDWAEGARAGVMLCWTLFVPLPAIWLACMIDEAMA